jgi:hypothetical protein
MLWGCRDCHTRFSVGAPCCPHCTSTNYTDDMEEIARWGEKPLPEAPDQTGEDVLPVQVDYSTWKIAELRADLDRRRAEAHKDDKDRVTALTYAKDATRDQLVAKLTEDDQVGTLA